MIEVKISKDKLEALITIIPEKNEFPGESEIKKKLAQEGIIFGINNKKIQEIAKNKNALKDSIIAKGKKPSAGKNAEIIWSIEINYSTKPTITDTNRADFKQLKLFERVKKNQVLASKLPPSEGIPGKNVLGEKIIKCGSDINFPAGNNTWISEDGLTMYSAIDGYAYWDNNLLHIDNIYQIKGNVDYHTGNISASGTVIIEGDVRSGFRVEATESIIIGGNVEAASLYSQNGDISIQCGVLGGGRAKILSGGNLACGFIQDATVSVKKELKVKHYIINSMISAGGFINVTENEGLIRGGSISSGKGITALEVGSVQKAYTELNVRAHSQQEHSSDYWKLSKDKKDLQNTLEALKRRSSFIQLLRERVKDLSKDKEEEIKSITAEIEKIKEKIDGFEKREIEIRKKVSTKTYGSEIKIIKELHPNVKIDIGNLEYFSQNTLNNIRIFCLENEIIVESLENILA